MTPKVDSLWNPGKLPPVAAGEHVLALNCASLLGLPDSLAKTSLTHCLIADLTGAVLAGTPPDLVIMPLFWADQDAALAIERLIELGYRGKVAVLAPPLPNPRLVERELCGLGLRVTLISP
jgi:hypothetical protein